MSFVCPIKQAPRYGLDVVWVKVPISVPGVQGEIEHSFLFDTGCEITTVSEDVASKLGLPPGGRSVNMSGLTGSSRGRLVDVRFQFPRTVSGGPGMEVESTWVVSSGRTHLALLGFMEVHRHFQIKPFEFDVYFIPWPKPRGT